MNECLIWKKNDHGCICFKNQTRYVYCHATILHFYINNHNPATGNYTFISGLIKCALFDESFLSHNLHTLFWISFSVSLFIIRKSTQSVNLSWLPISIFWFKQYNPLAAYDFQQYLKMSKIIYKICLFCAIRNRVSVDDTILFDFGRCCSFIVLVKVKHLYRLITNFEGLTSELPHAQQFDNRNPNPLIWFLCQLLNANILKIKCYRLLLYLHWKSYSMPKSRRHKKANTFDAFTVIFQAFDTVTRGDLLTTD